jgi:hypothetical protein
VCSEQILTFSCVAVMCDTVSTKTKCSIMDHENKVSANLIISSFNKSDI